MSPTCECNRFSGCAVSGTLDLYHCFDVFVSISAPHFHLAESSLREAMEGMNPRETLHETGCYIDLVCKFLHILYQSHFHNTYLQQTGLPLIAHERIQVNFLLKRIPEYHIFRNITGDTWLPLLWFEESFKIEKPDLVMIHLSKMWVTHELQVYTQFEQNRRSQNVGIGFGYILMIVGLGGVTTTIGLILHQYVRGHVLVKPEVKMEEFLEQSSDPNST